GHPKSAPGRQNAAEGGELTTGARGVNKRNQRATGTRARAVRCFRPGGIVAGSPGTAVGRFTQLPTADGRGGQLVRVLTQVSEQRGRTVISGRWSEKALGRGDSAVTRPVANCPPSRHRPAQRVSRPSRFAPAPGWLPPAWGGRLRWPAGRNRVG